MPPTKAAADTPPTKAAADTPPTNAAADTPPTKAAADMPPTKAAADTPPTKAAADMPPTKAAADTPPTKAAADTPPTKAAADTPPTKAAADTPPTKAAADTPPTKAAADMPPTKAAADTPPTKAAADTPPTKAAADTPPTKAAADTPPTKAAADTPPTKAAADTPPTKAAADTPPTKAAADTPPTKAAADMPPTKAAADMPPTKAAADMPPTKAAADTPPTKAAADMPPTKAAADMPPTKAAADTPPTKAAADMPPTKAAADMPPTKAAADTPPTKAAADMPPTGRGRKAALRLAPSPPPPAARASHCRRSLARGVSSPPAVGGLHGMTAAAASSHLVVIGASAGGIEALSRVVATVPIDLPAAVVIAQHLSPGRPSRLQEILERHTSLPVRMVSDECSLVDGEIFVVPSNRDIAITDHVVALRPASAPSTPSVDALFASAAEVFGERLVAVVLTGTGSDGAAGARLVHEAGGTVVVQNPATAAFPGMPRSLQPPTIDFVAELDDIGPLLQAIVTEVGLPTRAADEDGMRGLLADVRERRGLDFSDYREGTVTRRLQRRMLAVGARDLAAYREHLRDHPDEEEQLVRGLLIKVTQFFRDPEAFDYLRERVLPGLMTRARERGEPLRLWSAGCATGEEAYSLAILTLELDPELPLRIFATDVDTPSIEFARRGVYPAAALAHLEPAVRDRYFTGTDGECDVRESVRDRIVFGEHDLSARAPFPQIDMVLCRNVLMYFTTDLQRRVLQSLAFSLRPGGCLVLGSAENVRPLAEAFAAEASRFRIFRRTEERVAFDRAARTASDQPYASSRLSPVLPRGALSDPAGPSWRRGEYDDVVQRLPVGVLLVDRRYDIRHINAAARTLLGIHGLALGEDLLHLLASMPTDDLRSAIDAAFQEQALQTIEATVTAEVGMGEERFLQISCVPRGDGAEGGGQPAMVLISVVDVTTTLRRRMAADEALEQQRAEMERLSAMMRGLTETNERLLAANSDLANLEESLREATAQAEAANEELETYSEELQASNEEFETVNEEMRATVEELELSNADLDARSRELAEQREAAETAHAELAVILESMSDAVAVLDESGEVTRSNPAFDALLARMGHDGTLEFRDDREEPLASADTPYARLARGETFTQDFRLVAPDGARGWFDATGRPITTEGRAAGLLIVRDIGERMSQRAREHLISVASHELRTPLTAVLGYEQRLLRLLRSEGASDAVRRSATEAFEQTQRMARMVGELLDVSRLERGALDLTLEPVEIGGVVDQAVALARAAYVGRVIEMEGVGEGASRLVVRGDGDRLIEVVENLLTNALKHSPEDTPVTVRVGRADGDATVAVTDVGEGIPSRDLQHIFERFYQAQRSAQSDGLGLGLYLANGIVTAHGGRIEVRSKPAVGSTFTMHLPLLRGE